jgi:tetratricopeptide (TPR) repeat protein
MNDSALSSLDQTELVHLAMAAAQADDSAASMAYLKEAVSRIDATGVAHYLLGAEFAQARMYDRAIDEMEAALALDPALSVVRVQLALLWMGANAADKAKDVLLPLLELDQDHYLRLFGEGLIFLVDDQLDDAARLLREGQARNEVNLPLNGDMQRIIDAIGLARADAPPPDENAPEDDAVQARHVLLSAYTGNTGA